MYAFYCFLLSIKTSQSDMLIFPCFPIKNGKHKQKPIEYTKLLLWMLVMSISVLIRPGPVYDVDKMKWLFHSHSTAPFTPSPPIDIHIYSKKVINWLILHGCAGCGQKQSKGKQRQASKARGGVLCRKGRCGMCDVFHGSVQRKTLYRLFRFSDDLINNQWHTSKMTDMLHHSQTSYRVFTFIYNIIIYIVMYLCKY